MELAWEEIKVELAKRMNKFCEDLGKGDKIDGSVCGYFPEDIGLRMAEAAVAVLAASKAGQDFTTD